MLNLFKFYQNQVNTQIIKYNKNENQKVTKMPSCFRMCHIISAQNRKTSCVQSKHEKHSDVIIPCRNPFNIDRSFHRWIIKYIIIFFVSNNLNKWTKSSIFSIFFYI